MATISHVKLAAAHEGDAELIVTITYDNGGCGDVPLDRYASDALLAASGARAIDELIGQDWQHVRDALTRSFNRYQQ